MEQPYVSDQLDHKQPGAINPVRRATYGDEPDPLRNANVDLKYPFPHALYPASLSMRAGVSSGGGQVYMPASAGEHMDDPRYVPSDVTSDDKRRYLYQMGQFNGMAHVQAAPPPAVGTSSLTTQDKSPTMPGAAGGIRSGLVMPIPPLHVQQQLANNEDRVRKAETENTILSKCSRCKKEFVQRLIIPKDSAGAAKVGVEPKVFKLCHHCRDLQRQRSRRWQKKTKDKHGACRRCGLEIPELEQKFVLCPQCRQNLRVRKASRAAQGKCVHCLGPINSLIIDDEPESRRLLTAAYKVCQRCRENDKIRRTNLERMGNCNRCAKALTLSEQGKHKVCTSCRQKKKKGLFSGASSEPLIPDATQNVLVPPMGFISSDLALMMASGMPMQQDYLMTYGYQVVQAPDAYKTQLALPQMMPLENYLAQQYYGFQRPGLARDRMS